MENPNQIYPVTLSIQQQQAIEANRLDKHSVTHDDFKYVSKSWRIAEAENTRLRNQLQKEKRSVIKSIRELISWASSPTKKVNQSSIPGIEMELSVFGLTVVMGMASMVSTLLV